VYVCLLIETHLHTCTKHIYAPLRTRGATAGAAAGARLFVVNSMAECEALCLEDDTCLGLFAFEATSTGATKCAGLNNLGVGTSTSTPSQSYRRVFA